MTVNRAPHSEASKPSLMLMALVAVFAIAAFCLTRPEPNLQSLSPVSGLVTLKASAQAAIPYSEATANQKPTLVEFYADWCTTCQAMAPTLQSIHHQFGDRLNFVMLNIDDPRWQAQVQQFQVSGVPHLALLQADQVVADTFIGKVPKSVLSHRIDDLLS